MLVGRLISLCVGARLGSLELMSQLGKTPIPNPSPRDKYSASTIGGVSAGALTAAVFRGRSNVIPGMIVWGWLGLLGQFAVGVLSPRLQDKSERESRPSLLDRFASMKWSPMSKLSDEEYQQMLKERLLRIEAEMALVDEDLARLKASRVTKNDKSTN
ncbi:MAG: hypothetical protein Q9162_000435 [Coniocarpon cinnabarinum]